MPIFHHIYELVGAAPVGARAKTATRQGALLRVQQPNGTPGYADLHPWQELGDESLEAQLAALAAGSGTQLTRAALAFAALDGHARAQNRSLWDTFTVPPSHFLVPNMQKTPAQTLEVQLTQGFTRIKIKIGKDLKTETLWLQDACRVLQRWAADGAQKPLLRLDANETLAPVEFAEVWNGAQLLREWTDFVEDPCVFDVDVWNQLQARLGATLAVDRAAEDARAAGFAGVHIVKPARFGPTWEHTGSGRRVVTTYLDHPFGQICAAWVAAQAAPDETHGLTSHRVYAENAFSERLGWDGPTLQLPGGTGFGWDDLLQNLKWKPLP